MDERELETLFRDAAGDAPLPTFSAGDIAARSARETARRRMRVATTGAFAVLVLAGAGLVGVLGPGLDSVDESGQGVTSAESGDHPSGESGDAGQPEAQQGRQDSSDQRGPGSYSAPMQGGEEDSKADPQVATGTSGCHQVDRELAIALADELPSTASTAAAPQRGDGPCAEGGGRAAFRVREGAAVGLLSVAFLPYGAEFRFTPPDDAAYVQARTASGGTLFALSNPDAGSSAPLTDDLRRIADTLAADR
ncbi:MAG: hypothetical protein ACRDQ7_12685 [Haloechinothrix sp.]